MKYLVVATEGPGFASPDEALRVLESNVLPTFDVLVQLEAEKAILAGGLPVGERSLVFIAEAASNDDLDQLLRNLPMWGTLQWKVTPLQSFAARAAQERGVVKAIKKSAH